MKPFFGYPGGKSKVASLILKKLDIEQEYPLYIEPFSGSFSVGLSYADKFKTQNIWLNEFDTDLYCLWKATVENTDELCQQIKNIKINHNMFYLLQNKLNKKRRYKTKDLIERAVDKLLIHKISFSMLGEKAGGPVGGKEQKSKYKYDYRWNTDLICQKIKKISKLLQNIKITNLSYEKVLDQCSKNDLVYLDPPYVTGGPICYKHYFSNKQHQELAKILSNAKYNWFMTYDNHQSIQNLYKKMNIQPLHLIYNMTKCSKKCSKAKTIQELLISNF